MSWWRYIADQVGIAREGSGSWQRRVAVALGANNTEGQSWAEKIARSEGTTRDQGSWEKRLVDEADLVPGAAGRSIYQDDTLSGGGDDDALITIILTEAGRGAWVSGSPVAIDTLLGADPNTDNTYGTSAYHVESLTEDGYADLGDFPAAIGELRTAILAGATVEIGYKEVVSPSTAGVNLAAADGGDAIDIALKADTNRELEVSSWSGDISVVVPNIANAGTGAINVVAFTIVSDRIDIAANGSDAETAVVGEDERPPGNPFASVSFYIQTETLQYIKVYAPLPDTTGLSELSETGVTNTAPYTFEVVEWDNNVTPTGDFAGTVTVDQTGSSGTCIAELTASDDEGNPLTFTLVDDDNGNFQMGSPAIQVWYEDDPLSLGVHHFTVRATDPGGLFVEQEFTITVTVAYATLDDTPSNVTLSNGGLTATHDNTTLGGARSTALKNSGKYYFEVTVTDFEGGFDCIGLITAAGTYTNFVNDGSNCAACYRSIGGVWTNGSNSGKAIGTLNDGDVIGVAVDLDNEKIWYRKAPSGNWNGEVIGSQDPANNIGGASISNFAATTMGPAVGFGGGGTQAGDNCTANFGASAFTGIVPSGFTSGWPA